MKGREVRIQGEYELGVTAPHFNVFGLGFTGSRVELKVLGQGWLASLSIGFSVRCT